ncbi:MAG: polysaccharide export protein [Planctomycetota bacterium]|nr:polysaccharide export protein [Planctomycetota bacterium]
MGTHQPVEHPRTSGRAVLQRLRTALMAGLAVLIAAGCAQNELGRYSGFYEPVISNPKRVRNAIVRSENYWIQKDVVPEEQFPGPTPDDLKSSEKDYILGPGDLVDISVFELMSPGVPYATRLRISQTGQITFPYIGSVKCAGLTTRGLEEKLGDLLSPDYLTNPQVSVFVSEFRNLNVSVLNGVARPGLYPMAKQDMTLLELVAMSGGVMQLVEDYGYVIRKYAPEEADLLGLEGAAPPEGETPAPENPAAPPKEPKPGDPAAPGKAAPAAASPAPEKTAPDAGAPAPKLPEKAAPAAAPAAPEKAAPAAEPKKEGAAAPARPSADAAKAAREVLEKMAAGELPPVGKIEAAEAAAGQKPPAGDAKTAPAPEAGASEPKPPPAAKAPPPAVAQATPPAGQPAAAPKDEKELGRWIWSDGKWVEVKDKPAPEGKPAVAANGWASSRARASCAASSASTCGRSRRATRPRTSFSATATWSRSRRRRWVISTWRAKWRVRASTASPAARSRSSRPWPRPAG